MEVALLNKSLGEMQAQWQIQEMQLELISLTAKLPARSLNVARRFLEGQTLLECGALSGITGKSQEEIKTRVGDILREPRVKAYLDLAKQMMTAQAMQHVVYDKAQWMQDMMTVLQKAMGKEEVSVVTHFEGTANSDKVHKDDIAAAKSVLELLGKAQGWLVDNKNIQVTAVEKVRVRDFTHDRPDESELAEADEKTVRTAVDLAPHQSDALVKLTLLDDDDDTETDTEDNQRFGQPRNQYVDADDSAGAGLDQTADAELPDWE